MSDLSLIFQLSHFHFKEIIDGKTVWKGICIDILDALAMTLNFR